MVAQLPLTPNHPPLASQPPYKAIITDQSYAPLSRRFVRHCVHASSRAGDLILDPCCGTETVGVVAGDMHRRFIGIKIDAASCALAKARVG